MKQLLTKEVMAIVAIAMFGILFTGSAQAQDANDPNANNLFDINRILTLNITMDSGDWDDMVAECPDGQCPYPHQYWQATLTCGDLGPMLVAIRRKNDIAEPSELDPQKVSIKMDINLYAPGQLFAGKKKLSLENGSQMSTVTEGLTWNIYQAAGFISGRAAWCKVYVNGSYKGVYANVEQVDKRFLAEHGLDGIDNDGFLWKAHELLGEQQRTREDQNSPFAFNWYPFDHPDDPNNPEVATPNDWRDQIQWRINIPDLLALAVVENFTGNSDGAMQKMTNYWYYDWSTEPNDDPNFQQPRLYFPWDLDSTLRDSDIDRGIIDQKDPGHIWDGLIEELDEAGVPFGYPTHQADYLNTYRNLLEGPLELSKMLALVNNIESVIGAEMDLDPYSQLIADVCAAEEFQRIRDFLTDRTAYIMDELYIVTISGTVTVGGSGLADVNMVGLGVLTDVDGFYIADVNYGETYTVTPTKASYVFEPANRTYTNVAADHTSEDYNAIPDAFTISGTVTVGGSGLAGVLMSGLPGSPVTNGSGYYGATVYYGESHTVTPTKAGYIFDPNSRTYTNVDAGHTSEDYSATPEITLLVDGFEGAVWDANWVLPHNWLIDTSTYKSGSASAWAEFTDSGDFICDGLDANDANVIHVDFWFMKDDTDVVEDFILSYYNGTSYVDVCDLDTLGGDDVWLHYTDTITDSSYFVPNFSIRFGAPLERNENVWVDDVLITKEVPSLALIISGLILDPGTAPIVGVSVDANNAGGSDITDASGYYELEITSGWSGTVTPTKTDYTFDPTSKSYTDVTTGQTNQDYVATSIYDLYPDGVINLRDIAVLCQNWLTIGPDGDLNDSGHVDLGDFALIASQW